MEPSRASKYLSRSANRPCYAPSWKRGPGRPAIVEFMGGKRMSGTVIEEDLTINGNMTSENTDISVKGRVIGDITAQSVTVDLKGEVDGTVNAKTINILGRQKGSVTCQNLSLGPHSEVTSKISAETLTTEKGARLIGDIKVGDR